MPDDEEFGRSEAPSTVSDTEGLPKVASKKARGVGRITRETVSKAIPDLLSKVIVGVIVTIVSPK